MCLYDAGDTCSTLVLCRKLGRGLAGYTSIFRNTANPKRLVELLETICKKGRRYRLACIEEAITAT